MQTTRSGSPQPSFAISDASALNNNYQCHTARGTDFSSPRTEVTRASIKRSELYLSNSKIPRPGSMASKYHQRSRSNEMALQLLTLSQNQDDTLATLPAQFIPGGGPQNNDFSFDDDNRTYHSSPRKPQFSRKGHIPYKSLRISNSQIFESTCSGTQAVPLLRKAVHEERWVDVLNLLHRHQRSLKAADLYEVHPRFLHLAVQKDQYLLVKKLIEMKMSVNYQDKKGNTPLHIACMKESFLIIRDIINAGGSLTILNSQQLTPLCLIQSNDAQSLESPSVRAWVLRYKEKIQTTQSGSLQSFLNHEADADGQVRILPVERSKIASWMNTSQVAPSQGDNLPISTLSSATVSPIRPYRDGVGDYSTAATKLEEGEIEYHTPVKVLTPTTFKIKISLEEHAQWKGEVAQFQTREEEYDEEQDEEEVKAKLLTVIQDVEETPEMGPHIFSLRYQIGQGSFGRVFLVERKDTREQFAMKVIPKDRLHGPLARYAMTEKKVLSQIRHPYIVRLESAFQTQKDLFLIMEYCPGGDLARLLRKYGRLTQYLSRFIICEIILALQSLHERNIIFRDLKPENVLIDAEGHAKLTDFGLSKENVSHYKRGAQTFCGSYIYLAPEMVQRKGHGKAIDWYLLGLLLYELLMGRPPFYAEGEKALYDKILNKVPKMPYNVSKPCLDFLQGLMEKDPDLRLGSKKDAEEIKLHPWFREVNWTRYEQRRVIPPNFEALYTTDSVLQPVFEELNSSPVASDGKFQGWSFVNQD